MLSRYRERFLQNQTDVHKTLAVSRHHVSTHRGGSYRTIKANARSKS